MKVFTYFEPIDCLTDHDLLPLWQTEWRAAGFEPVILDREDARPHPLYDRFVAFAAQIPSCNPPPYTEACFLRWCALAHQGGGLMVDIDTFPNGITPARVLACRSYGVALFDGHVPAAFYASAMACDAMMERFLSFDPTQQVNGHDQALLAQMGDSLHAPHRLCIEYTLPGWADAPMVHYATRYLSRPKSGPIREIQGNLKQRRKKGGAVKFLRTKLFPDQTHRHGWNPVLKSLCDRFHSDDGILCDDFIEATFCWGKGHVHREPWIGFVHNPVYMGEHYPPEASAAAVLLRPELQASLPLCRGLITLSHDLGWKVGRLLEGKVPVYSLQLPIAEGVPQWDFDRFRNQPRIVHVGWWLRRFESFYLLASEWPKIALWSDRKEWVPQMLQAIVRTPNRIQSRHKVSPVTFADYLEPADYDQFLAGSVAFLDLIDVGANTVIADCLAAAVPVIVNPLPSVIEYLGEDYPGYYLSLEEAAEKLRDLDILQACHRHILTRIRSHLTTLAFLDGFAAILAGRATPIPYQHQPFALA